MKKPLTKRIFRILLFIIIVTVSGCNQKIITDSGFLEGTISIGPICPVETNPPRPECLPTADTYKAYPVSVWTANGRIKIARLNPALDGKFSIELIPGNYKVMLDNDPGIAGRSNLPAEVSISTMDKTVISINIDTGIR